MTDTAVGRDGAGRIVVDQLTKVFRGRVRAVDHLSFTVEPGSVTGFLGPNGAGKTTTLRMVLGLVRPTSGAATISGVPYARLPQPLTQVGAALESSSFHPARTGRNHLRVLCTAAGLPLRRADEVLQLVGLGDAGKRKVRGYSLGMRQRLGLAAALIGDPRVLVLDEPANGLDPDGIRWLRGFFRHLADEGRTILVSSHQLNEVEEVADRVVILNRGQLISAGSIEELTAGSDSIRVRTPNPQPLGYAVAANGGSAEHSDATTLQIRGLSLEQVGHLAFANGVELHELSAQRFDLEDLFFQLTGNPAAQPVMQPSQGSPA
jgi:ABC-2 type transport system ATP-binding protein